MPSPPAFASTAELVSRLADVAFWGPYLDRVLARHGLRAAAEPVAGFNPTDPTFVLGGLVVKLFGHFPAWCAAYEAERASLALVARDPAIAAPRVLADGALSTDGDAPWPYLVTSRDELAEQLFGV